MPQFLNDMAAKQVEQNDQEIPFGDYLVENRRLGRDFQVAMSFTDFCKL